MLHVIEKIFPFISDNFSQKIFHVTVFFLYWVKHMGLYPVNVSVSLIQKKSNNHISSTRKLTKTGCENISSLGKTLLSGILLHVRRDSLCVLVSL